MKIKPPIKRPVKKTAAIKEQLPEGTLTPKDFASSQEVRWCPGCGDYSILKQMQAVLPQIGVDKKDIVFVSGIGCSSRFPYYLDTFGMHSIHGRATAIASIIRSSLCLSLWAANQRVAAAPVAPIKMSMTSATWSRQPIMIAMYGTVAADRSAIARMTLRVKNSPRS